MVVYNLPQISLIDAEEPTHDIALKCDLRNFKLSF
jgi:hypothetical protein